MGRWLRALVLSALLPLAAPAGAAPIDFFGEDLNTQGDQVRLPAHPNADTARAQFLAELGVASGTEDFEGFAPNSPAPLGLALGGLAASLTTAGPGVAVFSQPSGTQLGVYPISASQGLFELGIISFDVTFAGPVHGFGFYGIDIGDGDGGSAVQLSVRLRYVGAGTIDLEVPHTSDPTASGSVLFFGVVDAETPFDQVTFLREAAFGDQFGYDDFVAPEPAAAGAAAAALAALSGASRARRRSARFGRPTPSRAA